MEILAVDLDVLGQGLDTLGEYGHLHAHVARILLVCAQLADNFSGLFFRNGSHLLNHSFMG